ncbi:uncharacterized protein [Nicotiana tomentosiformis]|uniref:uncharacterized protein n=1 Tax=Nicotiana tomentosiformis TaxID=4098 RepID=UPI00388C3C43
MSVREYSLRFDSLARYAPSIVATMRDRIHRFIAGLAPELTKACATAALQDNMGFSWIQAFAQNIERGRRQQQGTERTKQGQRKRMRFPRSQEQSQGSYRPQNLGWPPRPPPPQLQGYMYDYYTQSGLGSDACYTYGRLGHMMQDCPNRYSGGMAQPASSTIGSSMSVHPSGRESQSSAGRGRGRGRGSSSGSNQNCIYALACRQDQESTPDVVTSL